MSGSYGQFCPVSMAAEVVGARWTLLIVRELLFGPARFNDLRRGLARMSPALLSKRLKELEGAGLVETVPLGPGASAYRLTRAGEELRPIVMSLGMWGQRWVEANLSLKNLDPTLLMWDMRRGIVPSRFPPGRTTVQFLYPEVEPSRRSYWLVVEDGEVDLCFTDPGHEVDLFVRGPLRVMTAIWMGYTTLRAELASGTLEVEGSPALKRAMPDWLGLSAFAGVKHASVA
jgi:DNA-binding HxlR family transcriptional regulator